jgi:acyl carrier protein
MLDRDKIHTYSTEFAAGQLAERAANGNGEPAQISASAIELSDLDSFTIVEMLVALEDTFGVSLLQEMGAFTGGTFGELADFVVRCSAGADAAAGR